MFAFIKGELAFATQTTVVVETHGVGYQIDIPVNVFGKLPQVGEKVLLHTSFVVRELSQALYGFLSIQERDFFETLMGITGVGPKLALSIIGHLSALDLHHAIQNHDLAALCKIPGVGKKTAERLVIELRDKVATFIPSGSGEAQTQLSHDPKAITIRDAMSALINLGYTQVIAQRAIKKTLEDSPQTPDLPTLIMSSLKNI